MTAIRESRPEPGFHPLPDGQSETLAHLHREMTALFGILPVPRLSGVLVPTDDAEIEAQFDNMPV